MPTVHLTAKFVQTAQPQPKRVWWSDSKQPGLQLLVHPSGSKVYVLYRRVNDSPRRYRLANALEVTPQDARKLAQELLRQIALGHDPIAERRQRRAEATVEDLWGVWLAYAKANKRTWRDDERQWNTLLKPAFHAKRLSTVTRDDVQRWHGQLGEEHGPYAANRALALLSAMFTMASRKLMLVGPNPAIGVERFKEQARERFLSPGELARFFEGLDREPGYVQDFFRLLLYTGARKRNVLEMRFTEIAGDVWHPTRWKNGDSVAIPLVPEAVEILERRRHGAETDAVFPGRRPGIRFMYEPRAAWARILKAANLQNLRIHDLRRTLGSWQASQGTSLPIIGAMLGHRPGSSATAVYARLMLAPVREAAQSAVTAMLEAAESREGVAQ